MALWAPEGLRRAGAGWWEAAGRSLFGFREEAGWAAASLLVLGWAGVTGLAAQVSIPLPFTPVPVTGQVFAVILGAGLLGRWMAPASQAAYIALGAAGVPWFAPAVPGAWFSVGGLSVLGGTTGGYLLGFVAASAVVGVCFDARRGRLRFPEVLGLLLLGVGIVYAAGVSGLALVARLPPEEAVALGAVPFLPADVLKAVAAAAVLTPLAAAPVSTDAAGLAGRTGLAWGEMAISAAALAGVWLLLPFLPPLAGAAAAEIRVDYSLAAVVATLGVGAALALRLGRSRTLPRSSFGPRPRS